MFYRKKGFTLHLLQGNRKATSRHARKGAGFTLIELLVVIAIIGILATIVLINLNTARNKAKDAAIKGALSEARAAAEMWYDDNAMSYATFCTGATSEYLLRIKPSIDGNGGLAICLANATTYCVESRLVTPATTEYWCVDSDGISKNVGTTAKCLAAGNKCTP